jgi:hypothetical protein
MIQLTGMEFIPPPLHSRQRQHKSADENAIIMGTLWMGNQCIYDPHRRRSMHRQAGSRSRDTQPIIQVCIYKYMVS